MKSFEEISQHASRESCWVVIQGQIYDVTTFLDEHPGGARAILKYGGQDATEEYVPIHPPGTLDKLHLSLHLGAADMTTLTTSKKRQQPSSLMTPLDSLLTLKDFERAAEQHLKPKAWAFYRSAADEETAHDNNEQIFSLFNIKPRILRNVTNVNTSTFMLGQQCSSPIFLSPAALARMAHSEGEMAIAKAAGKSGLIYILSNSASCSPEEVASVMIPGQECWYQLYVSKDRKKSEELLRKVEKLGFRAIVVTVDVPTVGKRVRDERVSLGDFDTSSGAWGAGSNQKVGGGKQGVAQQNSQYIDQTLNWNDLSWIQKQTKLPLIVKGIQTWQDAVLCSQHEDVRAIILSNHGGRQSSSAPSSVETLVDLRRFAPQVFKKIEIYVDGGIRKGTDVVKACALGAKSCGIGRPALYAVQYGEAGVTRMLEILKEEIETNLKFAGVTKVEDLDTSYISLKGINQRVWQHVTEKKSKRKRWFWSKL